MKTMIHVDRTSAYVVDPSQFKFKEGDEIAFYLNDEYGTVTFLAVKEEEDGMIFISKDALDYHDRQYLATLKSYDDVRIFLNKEFIKNFPQDIIDLMLPFSDGDLLRLPSTREIFTRGDGWKVMSDIRNRVVIVYKSSLGWYWTRRLENNKWYLDIIDGESFLSNRIPYLRLVFKIKKF